MSKPSTQQDIDNVTGPRRVTIPTPFKPNMISRKVDEHVDQLYDIFLPLDGSGCFFPDARCWSQTRIDRTVDPDFFCLQLLMLLCETPSEGSLIPKALREREPEVYEETVRLAALVLMNRATPEQKKKLKACVKETFQVNLEFAFHVNCAVKQMKQKGPAPSAQLPPPPSGGAAAPKFPSLVVFEALQWLYSADEPLGNVHDLDQHMCEMVEDVPPPPPPSGAAAGSGKAKGGGGNAAPLDLPDFDGAKSLLQKIRFCVTPLPNEAGDRIAGIMCRFVVHDNAIDVGKFFDRVLENAKSRAQAKMASAGSNKAKSTFRELFPHYSALFYSQHPAGNNTSVQTYFLSILKMRPDLQRDNQGEDSICDMMNTMDFTNPKSPFHLSNVLTTARACERMQAAGVAERFWSNTFAWYDPLAKKCAYPATTYKYLPQQVFWYHKEYVGLSEQFFPQIDLETDFLSSIMSGDDLDQFLTVAAAEGGREGLEAARRRISTGFEKIRMLIETQWLISRNELMSTNLLSYDTNNEFIHRAAEAAVINRRVNQEFPAHYSETMDRVQELLRQHGNDRTKWRADLETDNDLAQKVYECERYNEIRQKSQAACLKVFESLWLIDGNVDLLPIPDTIKCMLRWYRDNQDSKFPNVTRGYMMWDKDLSLFGNSMLRHTNMYSCVAKILQPLICLLGEGLFSCYHYAPRQLMFNMMLHGRYDTGKTYAGISTLLKFTTIEGTVRQYTVATPASDTTLRHNYDLIVASDEVAPYKVSNAEAAKKPDLVNKEKVKMTDGQIGLECFSMEAGSDGEKHRWSKTVTTDHHITRIEVTNAVVEAMNALASRYFRMTVAQPKMPARKMDGFMGDAMKSQTVTYLQLNQYLTAWICKAEMCGAILPEIEMRLFHDVSNRAMDYLTDIGVIQKNVGSRGLEIMRPYARQLVYRMAIHYTFDLPSSPCYNKRFEPSMITHLQPYLYMTTDILWWTWTALAGSWFDESIANVVQAMRKAAGIPYWEAGVTTTYELYERDRDQIKWKTMDGGSKDIEGYTKGDERLIDITYVCLTGANFMAMCNTVASFTNPPLAATDVMGVVNHLKNLQISMKAGQTLIPQPQTRFAKWHRFIDPPNPATGFLGRKLTDAEGNAMPQEYRQRVPSAAIGRTVHDVPTYDMERSFPAMEVHGDHMYFMPGVDAAFKAEKIVEALEYAMLCKTTRPGKILLGFPEEKDSTQMQVYNLTAPVIERHISILDAADGWKLDPYTGENVWVGNPKLQTDAERPVSRRTGISFDRRDGITTVQARFFNMVHTAPIKEGDTSWKTKVDEEIKRMNTVDEICTDLDYASAKRQHMVCGRPLDEPVASPAYIEHCYKQACERLGRPWHGGMDYPHDLLVEMDKREAVWEVRTDTSAPSQKGPQLYKEARRDFHYARDPNMRNDIEQRKQQAQGTKRGRESMLTTSASYVPLFEQDETMQGSFGGSGSNGSDNSIHMNEDFRRGNRQRN